MGRLIYPWQAADMNLKIIKMLTRLLIARGAGDGGIASKTFYLLIYYLVWNKYVDFYSD